MCVSECIRSYTLNMCCLFGHITITLFWKRFFFFSFFLFYKKKKAVWVPREGLSQGTPAPLFSVAWLICPTTAPDDCWSGFSCDLCPLDSTISPRQSKQRRHFWDPFMLGCDQIRGCFPLPGLPRCCSKPLVPFPSIQHLFLPLKGNHINISSLLECVLPLHSPHSFSPLFHFYQYSLYSPYSLITVQIFHPAKTRLLTLSSDFPHFLIN